jgi:hypothetical protein
VPRYQDAYHGKLDKSQWGLVHVPQMVNYKGSIWANWDPDAPPFLDYLGGMKVWLDALLDSRDGREGGSEVIAGVHKWRLPCNWKFVAENFQGDMYHGATTHLSAEAVGVAFGEGKNQGRHGEPQKSKARDGFRVRDRVGLVSFPELGHGAREGVPSMADEPPPEIEDPKLAAYFQQTWEERQVRLAGKPRPRAGGNIFPNFSFHSLYPRSICVSHPRGPLVTEEWRWYLVDSDAPQEVKDALRHYYMRYSGPAGLTEQDDMENWNYASEASRGVIARRYPYNYQMGLGYTEPVDSIPGAVTAAFSISEENVRNMFKRWRQLMAAGSWSEVGATNGH